MGIMRTYIDTNVLIAAFRGNNSVSDQAQKVLDDPNRTFVVSDYLELEVLPKPLFLKKEEEVAFMRAIFAVAENVPTSPEVTKNAIELASRYNISPMDALHVGVAQAANVDEFITLEKWTKPMCQVTEVNVTSILPVDEPQ